jgi:ABC-type antimicrobial peptide transport system ATPase subunit
MLAPFLKYVYEGKVIRRFSDLQRFTFPEVTERIYLSFLALAVMSQLKDHKDFTKSYAEQTMHYGTFDRVRMVYNDLANMLAIVSGDPEITKKLKNKNQAQAMRLDSRSKKQVLDKINQHLKAKLPNTDIQRKFKEIDG